MEDRKRLSKASPRGNGKELHVVLKFKEKVDPEVEASMWRQVFDILGVFDLPADDADNVIHNRGPSIKE